MELQNLENLHDLKEETVAQSECRKSLNSQKQNVTMS